MGTRGRFDYVGLSAIDPRKCSTKGEGGGEEDFPSLPARLPVLTHSHTSIRLGKEIDTLLSRVIDTT